MVKVSVIIPIYNGGNEIARCLNSLIQQTLRDIEIICLNDGSKDDTLMILKKYADNDKRIIIIDKENTGVSDTRNIGIKKASGKYICFGDHDDYFEKDYLEIMYNTIKKQNVDIVRCNYIMLDSNQEIVLKGKFNGICNILLTDKRIKNEIIPMCLGGSIPCYTPLLIIDKSKLKVEFPTDVGMMEDFVFYIELLATINSMYVIEDELYNYCINDKGASNNVDNYERNILNILKVNKIIRKILKENKLETEKNINNLNLNHLNSIADYIFKYYLYCQSDVINVCQKVSNYDFINLIENTNLKNINFQRRIILVNMCAKRFNILNMCFLLRKIIYKIKHFNFKK